MTSYVSLANILIGLVYPPECALTLSYRANNNLYDDHLVDDLCVDVSAYKDGAHRERDDKDLIMTQLFLFVRTIFVCADHIVYGQHTIYVTLLPHLHWHEVPQVSPEVSPDGSRLP